MPHPLELQYGLTAEELLDAINKRFRAKVTLEGAVAEVQLAKKIKALKEQGIIIDFEEHDRDAYPDFTVWVKGRKKGIRLECKNVRDSDEAYRNKGMIVAYKIETQKTRASKGDPSSRFYGIDQFEVLAVCLGKKTGKWTDFVFVRTSNLSRHARYKEKLAVMHRVPLTDSKTLQPWFKNLEELLPTFQKRTK